LIFALGDTWPK
jgi:hypothetical protein